MIDRETFLKMLPEQAVVAEIGVAEGDFSQKILYYEVTCKELEVCRKKVKENGIIAGHDYIIGQWDASIRYGVIEAVHEFCIKYGWEMIYLTYESHRHLSFALKPFEN